MVRKKSIPKRCQGANTSLTKLEQRAALVFFLREQEEQIISKVAKKSKGTIAAKCKEIAVLIIMKQRL